jgi:hypothetical protein
MNATTGMIPRKTGRPTPSRPLEGEAVSPGMGLSRVGGAAVGFAVAVGGGAEGVAEFTPAGETASICGASILIEAAHAPVRCSCATLWAHVPSRMFPPLITVWTQHGPNSGVDGPDETG